MTNLDFGNQLRILRQQTLDPKTKKQLTQQKLGELLGEEMGDYGFSGAAISDWERNKSKINVNDRPILTSIVKILKQYGGIKTSAEANLLLEAGNYRSLNDSEKQKVFPNELSEISAESSVRESTEQSIPVDSPEGPPPIFDFQSLISDTKEAAPPVWSLVTAAMLRRISDRMDTWDFVRLGVWLLVSILAYILLSPALQWPFTGHKAATDAIVIYIYASFALPLCIGILTNTKHNPVWKDRIQASSTLVRLYTYQGAAVGFHVGYFMILAFHLVAYYLQVQLPIWFQFLLVSFALFMGAVGANVVPDNLWRAYKRLSLRDGWVFFAFVLVGPFWGWFFLQYYSWLISPILGAGIIITALIFTAVLAGDKKPK